MIKKFLIFIGVVLVIIAGYLLYQHNYGNDGDPISIQASNGKFVTSDRFKNDQLVAARENVKEWEVFYLIRLADQRCLIKDSRSHFVKADNFSPFKLRSSTIDPKEADTLVLNEVGNQLLITDASGRHLTMDSSMTLVFTSSESRSGTPFKFKSYEPREPKVLLAHQSNLLTIGLIAVFLSIVLFQYFESKWLSVFLLMLGAFFLRMFMAELAHHLHYWDEQFHALVAKNMMTNPFKPMLFANPTLAYDQLSWVSGHIWLHKQPLFLWQMALSMKAFGVNTLAVRIPSILMSAFMIPMIYRMGKIGFSEKTGFYGALFFAVSNFGIQLSGGAINTDHNDVAFLFYVCASVWAWFEFESSTGSRKWMWIVLIGLFSGGAILVKWLTGLLVYAGWGISILWSKEKRSSTRSYLEPLLALAITVLVFLPWQLYIHDAFPVEYEHESALISKHFFESVEGHGEPFFFHFEKMLELYSVHFLWVLILFFIFLKTAKTNSYKIFLVACLAMVYLFFSFAVTKMIAFSFCISFIIYIIFGQVMEQFFRVVQVNKELLPKQIHAVIFCSIILSFSAFYMLDIDQIITKHAESKLDEHSAAGSRAKTAQYFDGLSTRVPNLENSVIFNCKVIEAIPLLFHSNTLDAHNIIPNKEIVEGLKRKGLQVVIFDNGKLPDHLKADPTVIKVSGYY